MTGAPNEAHTMPTPSFTGLLRQRPGHAPPSLGRPLSCPPDRNPAGHRADVSRIVIDKCHEANMEPTIDECRAAKRSIRERMAALRSFVMDNDSDSEDNDSDSESDDKDSWLQALVSAAHAGDVDQCERALDACDFHGADPNRLTCNGRGSLLASSHAGHGLVVALLLKRGVRASTRGWNDTIALQQACGEGHLECARLLLGTSDIGDGVSDLDGSGMSALRASCAAGHTNCARLLLERGASSDAASPQALETALQAAAKGGHVGCAATLLEHGAATDLANSRGSTALHLASGGGHIDIVLMLCGSRADVTKVDARGRTALHVAAHAGYSTVCQALVEQGACCEVECMLRATPLIEAIENEQPAVARVLQDMGAKTEGLDVVSLSNLKALVASEITASESRAVNESAAASVDSSEASELLRALLEAESPLPRDFALQAERMPPVLKRLLVDNDDPASCSAAAVLRASGIAFELCRTAFGDLARPADEMLLRLPQDGGSRPALWASSRGARTSGAHREARWEEP